MKRFLLLLLALPCFFACHQVKEFDDETYIVFPPKDTLADSINWQQENMRTEFQLRGNNPLRYALHPVNDTITQLSRWVDGTWQLQESIQHSGWVYHYVEKDSIRSYFKITDFDKDGDQDLTCVSAININANTWTIIFLYDEKQSKLIKLINTAATRFTDIWDDPHYDTQTGLINTELYSGANGIQNTATYRLQGTSALPVLKEETNFTYQDYYTITTYKGEHGRWKRLKTITEKQ